MTDQPPAADDQPVVVDVVVTGEDERSREERLEAEVRRLKAELRRHEHERQRLIDRYEALLRDESEPDPERREETRRVIGRIVRVARRVSPNT